MTTQPPTAPRPALLRWRGQPLRWHGQPLRWRALYRPSLLVVVTVLLITPPSGVTDVSSSGHVTPADLAAGVVILVVALRLLAGDRIRTRTGWLPFAAAVVSFAVATIVATDVSTSARGFIRYSELFVLIPVAVAMSLRDRFDILLVAGALVAVTVVEGAVGGYQYLTKTGASYGGQYVRAVGTFGADQVEALGALLGYGLLVTLALGLATRGRTRIALVGTAVAVTVPLWLTLSRGAWIATAAAVVVLLLVFNWRAALGAGCAALLAVGVMVLQDNGSGAFNERLTSIVSTGSTPDRSVRDRYALWSTALAMWADHPLLGVGMKGFAQYRDSYAPLSLSAGSDVADRASGFRREPLLSPHNQYLLVASEQGTVGILAFGGLLGTLAVGSLRRRRVSPAGESPDSESPDGGSVDSESPDSGSVDSESPDSGSVAGEPAARFPADPAVRFPDPAARFLDLAAPALMTWTLIDFMYGDVGAGPISVLLGILLGLAARRAVLVPETSVDPGSRS